MAVERKKKDYVHNLTRQDILEFIDKDPIELLKKFNQIASGLERFLQGQNYFLSDDKIDFEVFEALIECASRICSIRQTNLHGSVQKFLRKLTSYEKFIFDDVLLVLEECINRKQKISLPLFTKHYIIILKSIMRGDFSCAHRVANFTFPALQNILNIMKATKMSNVDDAIHEYNKLKRDIEMYEKPVPTNAEDDSDEVQLFRNLSIMPRENDVINVIIGDLPCNIIDEPYRSINHYLSVHFRLMREDMLRSFRECIKFLHDHDKASKFGYHVYEKVTARFPPEYTIDGICFKIDVTTEKEIDWSKKDVLMPGNIVFLTPDNFRTIYFATVKGFPSSSESKSKKAVLEILFDDIDGKVLLNAVEYLMCEPNAYFECYKHVLSAIKEFSTNNFPDLSDILVKFEFDNTVPQYLLHPAKSKVKKYCLHENITDNEYKLILPTTESAKQEKGINGKEKEESLKKEVFDLPKPTMNMEDSTGKKFNPLNYNEWPTAEELKLDYQQHKAFMTALTNKVVVIQGPPGTGKTYIGVKIVKALLENVPYKPIIICCVTNHALDQFLENIMKYTKNIVRLGSQSKSDLLEPNSLVSLMQAHRKYKDIKDLKSINSDQKLKKSLDHLLTYAPNILKCSADRDESLADFRVICTTINKLYADFYLCQDKYLDDSALNMIIDMEEKRQLRSHFSTDSKTLCASVMEWLNCNRSDKPYDKCKKRFEKYKKDPNLERSINTNPENVFHLTLEDRFRLFYVWRKMCLNILERDINDEKKKYREKRQLYPGRSPDPIKIEILKSAYVIGVTTTGAAKFRKLLRYTEPAILIVEEAAEVLESHTIASLLPTTQHLIMIGDHMQLRPLPANHELSEIYNLKISMFERLFKNGAPSATLVAQHRMKPCIADLLIQEELYSELTHYENVYEYEEIKGIKYSMFFFNHSHPENEKSSGTSASNMFEAFMVIYLAKYLCKQSYNPSQITILATYAAQVLLIQTYLLEENLEILVTTVDNYQGEENDIIIISFVRNNESVIGFLKENNRVCVALSRARKGMYCFGNFSLYARKSTLWNSIIKKVEEQNMIADKIPLLCQRHGVEATVGSPEEICEFIQQGCKAKCGFTLPCGHDCVRKCHYDDVEHIKYRCPLPCEKYISETKKCPRLCYERCKKGKKQNITLDCGHPGRFKCDGSIAPCIEECQKLLPCNHIDTIPCGTDISQYKCKAAVSILLPCKHKKFIECYKSKEKFVLKCTELKPTIGPCGHTIDIPCYLNLFHNELIPYCKNACGKLLNCGHPCVGDCCWCMDIGIHVFCQEKCREYLNCGHVCTGLCGSPCPPCEKKCSLSCFHKMDCCTLCFPACEQCINCDRVCIHVLRHDKCINQCARPCHQCEKLCERKCKHASCNKLCFEQCLIEPCSNFCDVILRCGHQCLGMCGDPCPFPCLKCEKEVLKSGNPETDHFVQLLDCKHIIEINALNKHISECLDCFMWPNCPVCEKSIFSSLRYKTQLKQAQENVLKSYDDSDEIEALNFNFRTMFGIDINVPAEFRAVNGKISEILQGEKPSSGTLLVLNHCISSLKELVSINEKLKCNFNPDARNRFETLLLWISHHLTQASYQQLDELDNAIQTLCNEVCA